MWKNKKLLQIVLSVLILCSLAVSGCEKRSVPIRQTEKEKEENKKADREELPRAYSYPAKDVPKLRDQKETNSCWAYASLSALEASKDKDTAQTVYSVEHLLSHNPFGSRFPEGGSYMVTMAYLLSWMGPFAEQDGAAGEAPETEKPACHVQEIRWTKDKDYEKIKEFVYRYGGVETAIYVEYEKPIEQSSYYNSQTCSYSYSGEETGNHDILILGWDDDYPAENFRGNVTGDGAFLCRNSWGEQFGIDGSFYVSYEDVNIGNTAVVYSRTDPADRYEQIYQSDLCGFTAQTGYGEEECWFANVYQAEEDSLIRAAGFYAVDKNTEYELYIVPDFKKESSFDERIFVARGFFEDAGFYTVDFPEAVSVSGKKEFAVVVKIKTENAQYPAAVECIVEGFSDRADLTDGKGYLSFHGQQWENVEISQNYNICLKAYADTQ